jgi:hypothetical protein
MATARTPLAVSTSTLFAAPRSPGAATSARAAATSVSTSRVESKTGAAGAVRSKTSMSPDSALTTNRRLVAGSKETISAADSSKPEAGLRARARKVREMEVWVASAPAGPAGP